MYMKYDTCLNSSSVDAILVVFADLFTKKANKRKPSLVPQWPEILLRANIDIAVIDNKYYYYKKKKKKKKKKTSNFVLISREYDTPG